VTTPYLVTVSAVGFPAVVTVVDVDFRLPDHTSLPAQIRNSYEPALSGVKLTLKLKVVALAVSPASVASTSRYAPAEKSPDPSSYSETVETVAVSQLEDDSLIVSSLAVPSS